MSDFNIFLDDDDKKDNQQNQTYSTHNDHDNDLSFDDRMSNQEKPSPDLSEEKIKESESLSIDKINKTKIEESIDIGDVKPLETSQPSLDHKGTYKAKDDDLDVDDNVDDDAGDDVDDDADDDAGDDKTGNATDHIGDTSDDPIDGKHDTRDKSNDNVDIKHNPKDISKESSEETVDKLMENIREDIRDEPETKQYLEEQSRRNAEHEEAQADQKSLEFPSVDRSSLKRIEDVFVSTETFDKFLGQQSQDYRQRHIFLIAGPPNTGRYAVALHFALHLNKHNPAGFIREHIPDRTTASLSLLDIINRVVEQQKKEGVTNFNDPRHIPKDAVIIIRDTFSGQIGNIRELNASYARRFNKMLEKHNIRIILTTDLRPENHRTEFSNFPYLVTIDEQGELLVDVEKVFDRHLDLYIPETLFTADLRNLIQNTKSDILKILPRPVDIYTFFEDISNAEPNTVDEVTTIAEKIVGNLDRRAQTREWFEGLTFNEKLYVMFAVLFQGLNRYQLDELYDESVQYLRQEMKERFDDPRNISIETLLERVRMKEQREILEFVGKRKRTFRDYEDEIQYQIKNYYRLLWSLVKLFAEKIKSSPAHAQQQRRLLATVIGQIGIYRKDRLIHILDDLIINQPGYVTINTGETLAYIARQVDQHTFVIDVLRGWIDSKDFEKMWAAIVSIERVYRSITATFTSNYQTSDDESSLSANQIARQTLEVLRTMLGQLIDNFRDVDTKPFRNMLEEIFDSELNKFYDISLRQLNEDKIFTLLIESLSDQHRDSFRQEIYQHLREGINKKLKEEHQKRLEGYLLELVDSLTITIVLSVVEIAKSSPLDIIELLKEWLGVDSEQVRWQVARLISNQLYRDSVESGREVVDTDQLPYLDLLPAMLEASEDMRSNLREVLLTVVFGEQMAREREGGGSARRSITRISLQSPIQTALESLTYWYRYLQDSDEVRIGLPQGQNIWRDHIYPALLKTVNTAKQSTRQILGDGLIEKWLDSSHVEIRRSAMALLTRAYVLDGIILDVPTSRYGVLVVDAGESVNDEYLTATFNLSQRLATLTPLRIHHLGWTIEEHLNMGIFQQDNILAGTIQSEALHLKSATRPRLIMPVLAPLDNAIKPLIADNCHFILVLNMDTILDIDDVLWDVIEQNNALKEAVKDYNVFDSDEDSNTFFVSDNQPHQTETIDNSDNPFLSDEDQEALQSPQSHTITNDPPALTVKDIAIHWEWDGKFFVFSNNDIATQHNLPDGIIHTYGMGNEEQTGKNLSKQRHELEKRLQEQIIINLHQMDVEQWITHLQEYRSDERDTFHNVSTLIEQLDRWMEQLNDVMETIPPRDVTLSIAWTILLSSKQDLKIAVDIVYQWLVSPDENYQRIGVACTKQLFNFYGITKLRVMPDEYDVLLRLLPPFMEKCDNWREFQRIIHIIIHWAREQSWSERLITHPDGQVPELIASLSSIKNKDDIEWLLSEIEYYEAFLRIQDLFLQFHQNNPRFTLDDFKTLFDDLIQWLNNEIERLQNLLNQSESTPSPRLSPSTSRREQRRKNRHNRNGNNQHQPTPLPRGISGEMARQLLEFPGLKGENQNRIITDMGQVYQQLKHNRNYRQKLATTVRNMKSVMDTMRLQLYSRDTQRPPLPEGKKYGLILLDVSSQAESAKSELPTILIDLLKSLINSQYVEQFVPVVHRMGRYDVIYTHQRKPRRIALKSEEIWPKQMKHRFPPIIGPIINNYPSNDVGFVILLTASVIHDVLDFDQDIDWSSRMFIYSMTTASHIKNMDRILQDNRDTEEVIKRILNKVIKRG